MNTGCGNMNLAGLNVTLLFEITPDNGTDQFLNSWKSFENLGYLSPAPNI